MNKKMSHRQLKKEFGLKEQEIDRLSTQFGNYQKAVQRLILVVWFLLGVIVWQLIRG